MPLSARSRAICAARDAGPPDLTDIVGGPLGLAEATLPAVAFVVAYSVSGQETQPAAVVAVGLAGILTLATLRIR